MRYSTCVHTHQICRDRDGIFGCETALHEQIQREIISIQLQPDVYGYHRLFLPPLREPTGGLQPAAESPEPGSREADTASGTVNPTDTHTATEGGSAAR